MNCLNLYSNVDEMKSLWANVFDRIDWEISMDLDVFFVVECFVFSIELVLYLNRMLFVHVENIYTNVGLMMMMMF